jgi:hypothetical protein
MNETADSLARGFAEALAEKDFERAGSLLDPDVSFRALTPNRAWEATSAGEVVSEVLPRWLEESDHIDELVGVECGMFADRARAQYALRGHNDDGPFVVEQLAYFTEKDGRIDWLRVLCSGFRHG